MVDYMNPLEVLLAYDCHENIREFTNKVAKLCTKPTFIPALNKYVSMPHGSDNISPHAFILAHAVQILLFSPRDWNPYRVYSRDQRAYAHRFPTPKVIGGGTTPVVGGLFSMEDLYRAILLFYYLLKRRSVSKWITKTAPTSSSNAEFPGYHDPTSPSVDHGAHHNPNEPRAGETSPSASDGVPQANEVNAGAVNNEANDSDNEDRSDQPEDNVNESERLREDESEDENEAETQQSGEGNGESNQGNENEDNNEDAQVNEDEDADMSEGLNEAETIEGLKTITINTLILESLTTTRPSESLSQRLRDLGKPKAPPISSGNLTRSFCSSLNIICSPNLNMKHPHP
ncbi:hypothetical protein LB505_010406 [Fusarium chuoi]|nr:hypothetical protein LB505_010406 [Fusarium chuoi]